MEVGFCICVRVFVMCVCDMYECLKAVTNGEWRGKEHGAWRAEERKGARCKLSAIWVQVHRAESGRRTVGQKQHTLNVKVLCKQLPAPI